MGDRCPYCKAEWVADFHTFDCGSYWKRQGECSQSALCMSEQLTKLEKENAHLRTLLGTIKEDAEKALVHGNWRVFIKVLLAKLEEEGTAAEPLKTP